MPMNNHGQTVVESCLSLFVLSGFITAFLFTFYALFLNLWIPHLLYENNICLSSYQNRNLCTPRTKKQLQTFLWGLEDHFELRTYRISNRIGSLLKFHFAANSIGIPQTAFLFREEIEL